MKKMIPALPSVFVLICSNIFAAQQTFLDWPDSALPIGSTVPSAILLSNLG